MQFIQHICLTSKHVWTFILIAARLLLYHVCWMNKQNIGKMVYYFIESKWIENGICFYFHFLGFILCQISRFFSQFIISHEWYTLSNWIIIQILFPLIFHHYRYQNSGRKWISFFSTMKKNKIIIFLDFRKNSEPIIYILFNQMFKNKYKM